jgi:hypothetical protein
VLAEADAAGVDGGFGEAGPIGDAGVVAVGADEVAGAEDLTVSADEVAGWGGLDALDRVLPVEADAQGVGAVKQKLVEDRAANASAGLSGKVASVVVGDSVCPSSCWCWRRWFLGGSLRKRMPLRG